MPNIVVGKSYNSGGSSSLKTDDLLINLDAKNYVSPFATWPDDSGNNRDFSLRTNFVTSYVSSSPTYFGLQGSTNDYASYLWNSVPTNDFTYEFWIRVNQPSGFFHVGAGNTSGSFGPNSGAYDRNIGVNSGGLLYFRVWDGVNDWIPAGGNLLDGRWHHVVASLGTNGIRIYLDGSVVGSIGIFEGPSGFSFESGLILGSDTNNVTSAQLGFPPPPNPFNGDMAVFRMYGVQLTDAEVQNNYNELKSRF